MKNTINKILCLSIALQMAFGSLAPTFVYADSKKDQPVTSPDAFLKAVQEEGNALFGPGGPATFDEKTGKIVIKRNSTTSEALNDDDKKPNSLNTQKAIEAFMVRAKKAQEIMADIEKKSNNNQNCPTCGINAQSSKAVQENESLPADAVCSKAEKAQIKAQYKTSKTNCWGDELSNAPRNVLTCGGEIIASFLKSLGRTAMSIYKGGAALVNYSKAKLYDSYKPVESAATGSAQAMSNMSDKDRAVAKRDVEVANRSFAEEAKRGLNFFFENFIGLDIPMYSELFACAKCGDRMNAFCKVVGVVGRDALVNYLIGYAAGKGIMALAKVGAKMGARGARAVAAGLEKTALGRAALKTGGVGVKWAGGFTSKVGAKAVQGFTYYTEKTLAGKATVAIAKFGMKIVSATDDAVLAVVKGAKGMLPSRIAIGGGRKVAGEIAGQAKRAEVFAHTPGLEDAAKAGEVPGLSPMNEVTSTSKVLDVEVKRPATKEMRKGIAVVDRLESKGVLKGKRAETKFIDDIENATVVQHAPANNKSIKIETPNGTTKYVSIQNPENVKAYHAFGAESEKGIIVTKDNKVFLTRDGKVIGEVPSHERKTVDALLGKEEDAANQLAVQNAKDNIIANGGKIDEPNASFKEEGFKTKTPEGCEPGSVNIVKRAI